MIVAFIQPLFADIGQVIFGIVALIFLVVRTLLEAKKPGAAQRLRPVPPPQPQPQGPGAMPGAGQQADPLRAQVEEFLRRASRPPQEGPPRPQQPAPSREIEVVADPARLRGQSTVGQPLRQAEWRSTPSASDPAQSAVPPKRAGGSGKARSTPSAAKPRRRQSVAEHVAETVAAHTQSLANKASQLGQRIVAEDQQFDVQLKAKFDHTVGTLTSAAPADGEQPLAPTGTPAAQLAALLANPTGMQQAVLINEILRRPSERW